MVRGKFVVVEGLDGVGKGEFLRMFIAMARQDDKVVYDLEPFWKTHDRHPSLGDNSSDKFLRQFNVLVTAEPTFCGIGRYIREELIADKNRNYTPEAVAEAYALDRRLLYEQVVLPALDLGIDIYQSRSFSSSIVYQRQSALDLGRDFSIQDILSIPGNAFCYAHPMDFLVIPTIADVEEAIRRSQQREKDDNCKFENLDFQLKLKEQYENEEFKQVFAKAGVPITYLDAGQTLEFSKEQAREFYVKHLR